MSIKRRTPAVDRGSSQKEGSDLLAVSPGKRQAKPFNGQPSSPQGVAQLVACLKAAGYKVTGRSPHWMVQCPLHDDKEPSLGIDVAKRKDEPCGYRVLINCRQCGTIGKELCERFDLVWGNVLHHPANRLLIDKPPPKPAPIPLAEATHWSNDLQASPQLRAYLHYERLIPIETILRYGIGYDKERNCYTLPVWEHGKMVNLRRYYRQLRPKMRGLAGRTTYLYPELPTDRDDWLLLCEGEWDALVARSHGLPAFTSTGGACDWKAGWDDYFINKDVAIIYDCDDVGRREAAKRGRMLAGSPPYGGVAHRVKVVDLAPDRDDGYDLSDWFTSGRTAKELRQLIRSVAPLGGNGRGGR